MSSLERTSGGYVVAGLPQTCLVNNLPPEIFDMVVAYVFRPPPRRGKGHVPLYATVCRRWQLAFERHSFRAIRLYSSQLDQFAEAFSSAPAHLHRRAALQTLRYNIILPTYTVTAAAKSERRRDWEANNTAFTQATRDLFRILHSWDRLGGNGTSTFRLDLSAFSPMDPSHRADKLPGIAARELVEDSMVDLDRLQRRFAHSYLSLVGLEAQPLPTAPHVGILTIDNGMGRLFEPHVAGTIAASLPALVKITWTLSDDEWRDPALRQVNRHCKIPLTPEVSGSIPSGNIITDVPRVRSIYRKEPNPPPLPHHLLLELLLLHPCRPRFSPPSRSHAQLYQTTHRLPLSSPPRTFTEPYLKENGPRGGYIYGAIPGAILAEGRACLRGSLLACPAVL